VAVSSQPFALFSENFEQVTHVKKLQNTHKQNFTHAEMHIVENKKFGNKSNQSWVVKPLSSFFFHYIQFSFPMSSCIFVAFYRDFVKITIRNSFPETLDETIGVIIVPNFVISREEIIEIS